MSVITSWRVEHWSGQSCSEKPDCVSVLACWSCQIRASTCHKTAENLLLALAALSQLWCQLCEPMKLLLWFNQVMF